jgi:type IX secretion system substrate protein
VPIIRVPDIEWGDTSDLWRGVWGPLELNDTGFGIQLRLRGIFPDTALNWFDANPVFVTVRYDTTTPNIVPQCQAPDAEVSVFPNPGSGIVNIECSWQPKDGILRIFTLTGQKVMEVKNIISSGYQLDIHDRPPGLYFIEIADEDKISRTKLIVR